MGSSAAPDYAAQVAAEVAARYGVAVSSAVRVTICPPMTFTPPPEDLAPANGNRRGWQRANEAKRANEARAERLRKADGRAPVSDRQQAAFEADQARRLLVAGMVAEGLSRDEIIARVGLKEETLRAWAKGVGIVLPRREAVRKAAPVKPRKAYANEAGDGAAPGARASRSPYLARVRELIAKGCTKADILRETGIKISGLDKLLARHGLKVSAAARAVPEAVLVRREKLAKWLAEGLTEVEAVDRLKAEVGVHEKTARKDLRAIGRVLNRPTARGTVPRTAPPEVRALRMRERAALREAVVLGATVGQLQRGGLVQHAVLERHIAALRSEFGASSVTRFPALAMSVADGDAVIAQARRDGLTYQQIQAQTGYTTERISAVLKATGLASGGRK